MSLNSNDLYRLLLGFSVVFASATVIAIFFTESGTSIQIVISTLAGSSIGFIATLTIQKIASRDQTEMFKAVTLEAEGVRRLPNEFTNLKWVAHATASPKGNDGGKDTMWMLTPLIKIGGSGSRFITYSLEVPNIMGELRTYKVTFIGLKSCVVGVFSHEDETTSTATFDTAVSAAGIYFGTAYLTDWGNERDLTLVAVSGTEINENNLDNLPSKAKAAFHHWFNSIDIRVKEAAELFPRDDTFDSY